MLGTTERSHRLLLAGLLLLTLVMFNPLTSALAQDSATCSGEVVEITFWNYWGGVRAPLLTEILDSFNASHPCIHVTNVTVDGATDTEKMLTAIAGGDVPDIYMTHTGDVSMWAELDAFTPLNDFIAKDGIDLSTVLFPGPIEASTFNGELIQIPFTAPASNLIYYNKELFTAAGLDPDKPPQTWDELKAAAVALTQMDGEIIRQMGFNPCSDCTGEARGLAMSNWLARNASGVLSPDGTEAIFDQPNGVETLQWMLDFYKDTVGSYENMVRQMGSTITEQRPIFYAGRIAMHSDGVWFLNIMREEAPDMLAKVGVFLPPYNANNPDAQQQQIYNGSPGYAIPRDAKHPEAAWEVLKYIGLSMDGGCRFFQEQSRTDSPIQGCETDPESNPFYDMFQTAKQVVVFNPVPGSWPEIQQKMLDLQETVLLGLQPLDEAVSETATAVRGLLAGS